jgi:SAM-dependent methyltransferase
MSPLYDQLGRGYARGRRGDSRWAAAIAAAVGPARSVLNVGAGTGSYETGLPVVLAVDPAATMLQQRPPGSAPAVRAVAEALPVGERSVDVALAVLTLHHWSSVERGLAELRRVARRQVVLTFEPAATAEFWLVREYIPAVADLDRGRTPTVARVADLLGTADVRTLPVPADMVDGVLAAHWGRPAAYLDPQVRARASGLAQLDQTIVDAGVARLARDLESDAWAARHADLLDRDELDVGYRLVVTA